MCACTAGGARTRCEAFRGVQSATPPSLGPDYQGRGWYWYPAVDGTRATSVSACRSGIRTLPRSGVQLALIFWCLTSTLSEALPLTPTATSPSIGLGEQAPRQAARGPSVFRAPFQTRKLCATSGDHSVTQVERSAWAALLRLTFSTETAATALSRAAG
jgi:hypothetical protein